MPGELHGQRSLVGYSPWGHKETRLSQTRLTWLSTHSISKSLSLIAWKVKAAQPCPTLCDPTDYAVHGILQARILEWGAFSFSRGSSQPRDGTQVTHIAGGFFTSWAPREAQPAVTFRRATSFLSHVTGGGGMLLATRCWNKGPHTWW